MENHSYADQKVTKPYIYFLIASSAKMGLIETTRGLLPGAGDLH